MSAGMNLIIQEVLRHFKLHFFSVFKVFFLYYYYFITYLTCKFRVQIFQ